MTSCGTLSACITPDMILCAGCRADRVATVTHDIIDKIVGLQNSDGECRTSALVPHSPCQLLVVEHGLENELN